MTQGYLKFLVLLPITLFLMANYCGPASVFRNDAVYLQCNESRKENAEKNITSCGIDSRILVEFQYARSIVQFNCYNSTPIKFNLPLEKSFLESPNQVIFNNCRFSEHDNILEILKNSLQMSSFNIISFDNQLIDNSLSRTNLRGLPDVVHDLSFTITNVSTLPTDLFADYEKLKGLIINSNSCNSSHLSLLLAPLKSLSYVGLNIKNQQGFTGSIFASQTNLGSLTFFSDNITAVPSGIFSNLRNLYKIYLIGNNYPSNHPENLSLETKNRKEFNLSENRVALKELPQGLLHDLPSLKNVEIVNCQLESIPSDIFNGSKELIHIVIRGNNLPELPFGLLAGHENLEWLELSENMIRTLIDGFFSCTTKLWNLDLSNNKLRNLPNDIFKPLVYLEYLNLENNNLLTISLDGIQPQPGSVFDNLRKLEDLILKNNSINDIPYRIMINDQWLLNLDLSFNNISSVDCNFGSYFRSNINLTGNPIDCDCKVLCLHQHKIQNLQYDFESSPIRCESPNALKGRLLHDLELSEVLCFPDIPQGNAANRCNYKIRKTYSVLLMNCSGGNYNDIPKLPAFDQSYANGIELIMDNNPLTELSSKIFKHNANICLLSINGSLITKFPNFFFSYLSKLRNVSLVLPLEEISYEMFAFSSAIAALTISGTNITVLPKLYHSDSNLIFLDLSKNRFRIVYGNEFASNNKLETLLLSDNFFKSLPRKTFSGLDNLKTLFLNNNCLQYIDPDVFLDIPSIKFINMENNQLKSIKPFVKVFGTLQSLLMRNNSIGNDYFIGIRRVSPSILDLSFNNISSIDLSNLHSMNTDTCFFNFSNNNIETIKVTNENISLNCDCKIASFKKENKQMNMYESLQCLSSKISEDGQVSYLSPEELLCPIKPICPETCLCWIRPVNLSLIVNCSNAGLTEVPRLPELETIFQNGIELSIDNNNLTTLNSHSQTGYKGVTKLFAAHNQIRNIFSEDIPENMSYFDVSYNQIERLDEQIIKVINESQTLKSILLYHNPLICDCSSENLTRAILANKTLFPDIDQCSDGRKFRTLSYTEFCSIEGSNIILIVIIVILCVLFFVPIFYFKNKEAILIWMYANKICLWWVTEEEVDKDRKYDAFISYSSLDAYFIREIVSKLECGEKPYKLCLHDRDWLGGGFIPDQIQKSVQRSKRTLIVLTENFVKSKWTRLEFRTAHIASLNEKRIRVIVVIVGDVNTDDLDSDLRKYLKMYTYLKWEDPRFWQKLYYALPHPSIKNEKSKTIRKGDADDGESEYSSDDNSLF